MRVGTVRGPGEGIELCGCADVRVVVVMVALKQ